VRERGATHIGKKDETSMDKNGKAHRRRGPSLEPRRNPSIDGKPKVRSTNRKHWDEALDEINEVVLSDSPMTYGLKVITHRNCRRSWNCPKLRRAILGILDQNWGGFDICKGLNNRVIAIYIYC
jgi:hypothetical protein